MSTKEKPAKTNANKPSYLDALRERFHVLEQKNAELDAKIKWYEEQHRLSIKQRFGSSSEKSMSEQINLLEPATKNTQFLAMKIHNGGCGQNPGPKLLSGG